MDPFCAFVIGIMFVVVAVLYFLAGKSDGRRIGFEEGRSAAEDEAAEKETPIREGYVRFEDFIDDDGVLTFIHWGDKFPIPDKHEAEDSAHGYE